MPSLRQGTPALAHGPSVASVTTPHPHQSQPALLRKLCFSQHQKSETREDSLTKEVQDLSPENFRILLRN